MSSVSSLLPILDAGAARVTVITLSDRSTGRSLPVHFGPVASIESDAPAKNHSKGVLCLPCVAFSVFLFSSALQPS